MSLADDKQDKDGEINALVDSQMLILLRSIVKQTKNDALD